MDAEAAVDVEAMVARAHRGITVSRNEFVELLAAGAVPARGLARLAAELHGLVGSDRRSQALLAARFPGPPAGDLFLSLARGEAEALALLADFAAAVGVGPAELAAHEPIPLAQAYPAYLTRVAVAGTSSAMALALLANVEHSGATYTRVADALCARYGLADAAVAHFRYFAETPPELLDEAAAVVAAGVAAGEDPVEAVRTARVVAALEGAFWDSLVHDLG